MDGTNKEGQKMNWKTVTGIIIFCTAVIWIGWDIFAYFHYGNSATESATLYRWSFYAPGVSFLFGLLCGHLFFPQRQVIQEIAGRNKTI
jgi:TRAP-type mannitol/chloroaromatic compound transport system permease small subunit